MSNITLDTMYQNIPFSKNTRLVNSIISSDNTITVEDASVFPTAPNYATIGTDENAETIFYNAISSNELQNVERAKEGTAKSWSVGEIISRNFSNVDVVAFSNNITRIANFLNSHGNLFEYRKKSTNYTVGKLVQIPNAQNYIYLECVEGGTSSGSDITVTGVGQIITDGSCKWLSLDIRDSAPVGTIKQDIVIRDGYLLLNGQIVNVSDYPRLVNFLVTNNLLNSYTASPDTTKFYFGDQDNLSLRLPNFEGLFLENGTSSLLDKVNAGLPNITGTIGNIASIQMNKTSYNNYENNTNALKWTNFSSDDPNGKQMNLTTITASGYKIFNRINLDASRQSSIYGNSSTVQPPAVKLLPLIKY